jgi:starvation-inducible outer membrane lipoprotein
MVRKTLLVLVLVITGGCTYPDPTGYRVFGEEKLRQIKQNPKRHAGELLAFGGLVTDTEERQDQTAFRMLVQDQASSETGDASADSSFFVVYPSVKTTVAKGHYVKVLGYIRESAVGKSLLGDRVGSLTLDAIAVYDAFTRYAFRLRPDEELFRKWQTGKPLAPD